MSDLLKLARPKIRKKPQISLNVPLNYKSSNERVRHWAIRVWFPDGPLDAFTPDNPFVGTESDVHRYRDECIKVTEAVAWPIGKIECWDLTHGDPRRTCLSS